VLIVGLTGGIGCGKSLATTHFRALGVPVLDADEIVRELTEPGAPALQEIAARFGSEFVDKAGALDRRRLRERVFGDERARRALEGILHPRVRAGIRNRLKEIDAPYCLLAVPLLVETGMQDLVHRVLVIDCDPETQLARVMRRDGATETQTRAILSAQATRAERLAAAQDVIENDGNLEGLERAVESLHARYLALTAQQRA